MMLGGNGQMLVIKQMPPGSMGDNLRKRREGMRMSFEIDAVSIELAQRVCDGLSAFLNENVLASGNKVELQVPETRRVDNRHFAISFTVEIAAIDKFKG